MPRPITADDLWALARVGQPEPLPDGSAALVPVTTHDVDADRAVTQLHLVTHSGETTQLTRGEQSATQPAIDASGTMVAFLRAPAEGADKQLHVMPLAGGEARGLTTLPLGAGPMRWMPDGSGLVCAVPLLRGHPSIAATEEEKGRRTRAGARPIVTEDRVYRFWKRWLVDGRIHHLFHIDLTGGLRDLTPDWDRLLTTEPEPSGAFDISPDGTTVAVSADIAPRPHERFEFMIHVVPVGGGEPDRLTPGTAAVSQRRPRFGPDGSTLLFGAQYERDYYADPTRLVVVGLDERSERVLAPEWDRSAGGWEFDRDGGIVVHAEDRGRLRIFTMREDDAAPVPIEAPGSWHGPRPAGGVVWCRQESSVAPPEVALIGPDGPVVVGTHNDGLLDELELGDVDEIEAPGADGRPVQIRLVYPPGFDRSRRWPLLHNIHGGPHGLVADTWHWRWNTQVFAAPGHVVASVNFHGSTSWGDEFTRSIRGAWGDMPATDVLTATDHLLSLGFIDVDRMAIAGGSYGGYLVTWLTTQTDRFAAAICHAGVTDLLGQWASDVTAGRERAIGGLPWEDMEAVLRWSPLAHTRDITTPTLVVHGEQDYRVVVTQGLSLYGILQHKGVPSRLVYYPDEGHWIETPRNSVHWYGEILAWLDRWIGEAAASG